MGKNRAQEIIIEALNYGKWNAVGCGWVKATTSIATRSQNGTLFGYRPFRPYSSFPRLDGWWTLLRVRHSGWICLNCADVWYYWYPRVIQPFHHHLRAYRPASFATSTLHCSSQVLVNLLICFWSPIYPSIDTQTWRTSFECLSCFCSSCA